MKDSFDIEHQNYDGSSVNWFRDECGFPHHNNYNTFNLMVRCIKYPHLLDRYIKIGTKTLSFYNDVFYSYNEPIAFVVKGDLMKHRSVFILNKTAKFGNFYSKTTSIHISKLITVCKDFTINYVILNMDNYKSLYPPNSTKKLKLVNKWNKQEVKKYKHECSICLEVSNKKNQYKLNCGHIFDVGCLKKWFKAKGQNECPLCKTIHDFGNNPYTKDFYGLITVNFNTNLLNSVLPNQHPIMNVLHADNMSNFLNNLFMSNDSPDEIEIENEDGSVYTITPSLSFPQVDNTEN